jgi:hypothetical protein
MNANDLIAKLRAENATLRDLLETQYRKTDEARAESDKADDEALEHKLWRSYAEAEVTRLRSQPT